MESKHSEVKISDYKITNDDQIKNFSNSDEVFIHRNNQPLPPPPENTGT